MDPFFPHEQPLYVVLPRGRRPARPSNTCSRARRSRRTRCRRRGSSSRSAWTSSPRCRTSGPSRPTDVERVLEAAGRLCTRSLLEARSLELWREADERVRQHFLKRGTLQVLAGIFRMGPRSIDLPPTEEFVADRVHEHRFEVQYRLSPERGGETYPAPPEEGSVIVYPFDLENRLARKELGLDGDVGPILEVFAYVWQHDRHRALWQSVAQDLGARLVP